MNSFYSSVILQNLNFDTDCEGASGVLIFSVTLGMVLKTNRN